MKIVLFEEIGNIGVVVDWNGHIRDDNFVFECDRDGVLYLGDKTFEIKNGRAYVPQYNILMGEPRGIAFTDNSKRRFSCGVISRISSHMIKITNEIEPCLIACCKKISEQEKSISELRAVIDNMQSQSGIKII